MGVKTESKKDASKEAEDGAGGKRVTMRAISEALDAEVEAAKTTLSSKQDETIKVEVTWKVTDFADKMRVQDSVSFIKVICTRRGTQMQMVSSAQSMSPQ